MSVRPVEFNGLMQRSQDVSSVKHQQDNRPVVEQQVIGHQEEKKQDAKMHKVSQSEKKDESDTHYDAREEGKNKYFSSRKDKEKKATVDKVVEKSMGGGFDIRI